MAANPLTDKLYVAIGSPCNVPGNGEILDCNDTSRHPLLGSISELSSANPGATLRPVAHGIRNTLGIDFHPATGDMWFTDNGWCLAVAAAWAVRVTRESGKVTRARGPSGGVWSASPCLGSAGGSRLTRAGDGRERSVGRHVDSPWHPSQRTLRSLGWSGDRRHATRRAESNPWRRRGPGQGPGFRLPPLLRARPRRPVARLDRSTP
jgi:hypothetical protein